MLIDDVFCCFSFDYSLLETEYDIPSDVKARIEEGKKINSPEMTIRFSRGWQLFGRKRKCDFPPNFKLLSHFQSTFFTPAIDKHKAGDYKGAMELYEKAVGEGSQIACFNIGLYYLFGVGVKKDFEKGMEWFKKGGKVEAEEVWMIRELSNRELFTTEGVDMSGLFMLRLI